MDNKNEKLKIIFNQMQAYNTRDIEGCLKYWADDLKVIVMPDEKVLFSNKQEVREHLQKEFSNGTDPKTKALESGSEGSHLYMVQEKTRSDGSVKKMKFTYLIEDGVISKMWGEPTK